MNDYLKQINDEFENKAFGDQNIEMIYGWLDSEADGITSLITRWNKDEKHFQINENEAELLKQELKFDYNILIKVYLNYLLSFSKSKEDSRLFQCCQEYIEIYFQHIDEDGKFPAYNLTTIVEWTIDRFPRYREEIGKFLYDKVMAGDEKNTKYYSLSRDLMRHVPKIFSNEDYIDINEKYFVEKTNWKMANFYLDSYDEYLKFLKEASSKDEHKLFKRKYIAFAFDNIDIIDPSTKLKYLPKIRGYMDDFKKQESYPDEDYYLIDQKLDQAKEEVKKHMLHVEYEISYDSEEDRKLIEYFSSLDNVGKINILLNVCLPFSKDEIKSRIENDKYSFTHRHPDFNGNYIDYDELNEDEIISSKASDYILGDIVNLYFPVIRSFFGTFKADEESKRYIHEILENNRFVSKERAEKTEKQIIKFFSGNFENSVFDIVEELEESLRYYLKNEKKNIQRKDGSGDVIGLGAILSDNPENRFKNKLCEAIGEDTVFTLRWLLVDKYGFNLRNRRAHRVDASDLYNNVLSIYAVIQILRVYWGYQK